MHGPATTTANDNLSYFPPQPAAEAGTPAAMSEQQQNYQQYENSDAQLSQPPSSASGYEPAMMDQHGTSTHQQHHQVPITTTTNRHVSDYSDSFEWEGTSIGTNNIQAQRYTSHPNSSTDSFYQPLSFGTRQHQRLQTSASSPFGSFSDSQSTYFAQPATSNIPSGPAAMSQTIYDPQAEPANTHNVFAGAGLSQPSTMGAASVSAQQQQNNSNSYMAIDTSISSRVEQQESEGYLSPSSSEPMAATPDPSQFFSPSQASLGGNNQHTSLSTFGRSASPSPPVSYTPTNYNSLYNTSSVFPSSSSTYRNTNYSSSGGLSDSSIDMDDSSTLRHSTNNPLLKQELHRNGKPKRPLNSFMIFARQRRPDLQKLNPNMKVADIAKELSKEWKDMPAEKKKEYFEAAKIVKESFHKMHPDYVYSRRPNGSRKSGSGGGSSSGHRRRASSATPSSSGSTTGGGTAADIGESATMLSHSLSLSSPPSANHHATPNSHRGKTRSRPLAGSKGAGAGTASQSGVRSSDSERSAFSPGYESNTSDAEMGNLHMPVPMRMPADLSQSFSFHSSAGISRDDGTADSFRSLAQGYEPQSAISSTMMDYDAPPLQQAQMSSSTSSAPGYLETHMSADTLNYQASSTAVQSFEEQLLTQQGPSQATSAQPTSHEQSSGSMPQGFSSIYPSSSIGHQQQHQQLPHGNIFATPEPRQQQSSAASHVQSQDFPNREQLRPSTAQSGYSQATSVQGAATPIMQGRPASSSRFGIHSFRNAGSSSSSTRPSTSLVEQPGVHSSSQADAFAAQQQQYQQRASSIFKEPAASSQTPSVSATVRAAMNSPSRLAMRSLQSFPDLPINTMSPQSQQQQMSWMHSPSVTSPAVAQGHRYAGYDPPQNMSGMSMDDSYIHDSGGNWLQSGPGKPIESPTGIVRMNSPPPAHLLRHSASTFSLPANRQGNAGRAVFGHGASRSSGISQTFARARSPSRSSLSSDESTLPTVPRNDRNGRTQPPLLGPYAAYASAPPTAGLGKSGLTSEPSSSTSCLASSAIPASAPATARTESFLVPQTPSSGLAKSARATRRAQLSAGDRQDREGSYASSTGATTSSERASSVFARASGLVYNGTGKARYTPLSYNETSVSRSYPHEAYAPAIRRSNQAPLPAPSNARSYVPGTPITLAPLRRDSMQMGNAGEGREAGQTRLPSLVDNLDVASDPAASRQTYTDYVPPHGTGYSLTSLSDTSPAIYNPIL